MSDLQHPTTISVEPYDVAILGGGLAGLTLALQLKNAHPEIRIIVAEKQHHPVPEAAYKVGESTVEIATRYLIETLGLGEHLGSQQLRKFGLRFFFSTQDNRDITRRVELGLAAPHFIPSYQLDRGRLENMLGEEIRQRGVTFLDECKVTQVALQPEAHHLHLSQDGKEIDVQARWVVDASGRSSLLKRQLGLAKKVDHEANAVWFRVSHKIDIDAWSSQPEWQDRITDGERYLSTNHLCGKGYWVWLIPLASGSTSVGIVTDPASHSFDTLNRFERAMQWLHLYEPQCAAAIEQYRDDIQDFRVMKNYSYSCQQVFSSERWCLTGEAGVFVDPLYSPGSDFIAMSNNFIADLIKRDQDGKDIRGRAIAYNHIYLSLANGWFNIYEKQYGLLGNAPVMVAKYIWDTAVYWACFGLLDFHDKLSALAEDRELSAYLHRISLLGARMQVFFREWAAIDQAIVTDAFVDHYNTLDFMKKFHYGMTAGLTDAEFNAQFIANVKLLERIAGQVISRVIEDYAPFSDNEAMANQIQAWQADPLLHRVIGVHQKASSPVDYSWINLAYRSEGAGKYSEYASKSKAEVAQ